RRTDQQGLDQALAFADGFAKTSGSLDASKLDLLAATPVVAELHVPNTATAVASASEPGAPSNSETAAPAPEPGPASAPEVAAPVTEPGAHSALEAATPATEQTEPRASETPAPAILTSDLCGQSKQMPSDSSTGLVGFISESAEASSQTGNDSGDDIDLIEVAPAICDMLLALDQSSLIDPSINLVLQNQDSTTPITFQEDDFLVIEAGPGDRSRRLFVDYVVHDGTVLHLFPDAADPDDPLQPGARLRLGEPGLGAKEWQIAPPFGNDLIVIYASEEPLHAGLREQVEAADDYLPYLRDRLQELAARTEIGIDYHVVQTVAR
ncbi:MAG: hypothetical protein ACR2Q4_07915, partial [Geminicoccaceae bacterium]